MGFLRRASSGMDGNTIAVRGNMNDMREHLKHLGPSNLASRPKSTRYNTVKIKSALGPRSESRTDSSIVQEASSGERYLDNPDHAPLYTPLAVRTRRKDQQEAAASQRISLKQAVYENS